MQRLHCCSPRRGAVPPQELASLPWALKAEGTLTGGGSSVNSEGQAQGSGFFSGRGPFMLDSDLLLGKCGCEGASEGGAGLTLPVW